MWESTQGRKLCRRDFINTKELAKPNQMQLCSVRDEIKAGMVCVGRDLQDHLIPARVLQTLPSLTLGSSRAAAMHSPSHQESSPVPMFPLLSYFEVERVAVGERRVGEMKICL